MIEPSVLVTHDCPQFIANKFFGIGWDDKTITRSSLGMFYNIHRPKFHFFGHHHVNFIETVGDTTFVCLNELSYVDFDEVNMKIVQFKKIGRTI